MRDDLDLYARRLADWLPDWAAAILIMLAAVALAMLAYRLVMSILTRIVERWDLFWRALVVRGARPMQLTFVTAALAIVMNVTPLAPAIADLLRHLLWIGLIACTAWGAHTALTIWTTIRLRRFKLNAEDNLLARKHVTQTRILVRVATVLIVIIAVAVALMTFDSVRQIGASLLASAGVAGIVFGFALQPVLKNLIAGIQLAITQPIRIDDAVIVEGEWGNVEEIGTTYVVVRIWDWRRLVVPLSYFIEQPFQNWTRESADLIGNVMLYLDYSAPLDRIRAKAQDIAKASALWDGQVFNMAVTDFRERVMEVRVLVSASNAGRAFDLRCEMREKLINYIQAEVPEALPRTREEMELMRDPDPAAARAAQR